LTEFILEVQGGSVVHGKFNTKTTRVVKKEDLGVKVDCTTAERNGSRNFGHDSMLLELTVVSLGSIVTDKVDENTSGKRDNGRDNRNCAPPLLSVIIEEDLEKWEHEGSHDRLSDAAAKVSPSSDKGVGSSNDISGEHAAGPVLPHDEASACNTDEETNNSESIGGFDETCAGCGDGGDTEHDHEENTGSVLVAHGSQNETHHDGTSDTNDRRSPDILLGDPESVFTLGKERSDGEPDEKGNEEASPRAVEGAHVWTAKTA
jgi:hypothetical protein